MQKFFRQAKQTHTPVVAKRHFYKRSSPTIALPKKPTAYKLEDKAIPVEPIIPPELEKPLVDQTDVLAEPETQISDIRRMIRENSFELKNTISDKEPVPARDMFVDTPSSFDGVSDNDEKLKLVEEQVFFEQRKARKLEHEINLLKAEFEEEKHQLEHTVKELKQELHRTAPLHDNKFFSLSKELRDAMDEIRTLNNPIILDSPPPTPSPTPSTLTPTPLSQQTAPVTPAVTPPITNVPKEVIKPTIPNSVAPPNGKKKIVLSAITAIVIVGLVTGFAGLSYMSKPKVDEKLVEQYLQKQTGTVAGAQIEAANSNAPPSIGEVLPDEEIPFEDTKWESFTDGIMGVQLMYPKNVVRLNKTDSSVTFLRKSGYLVKIQQVQTALSLKEYWEQIKATTLNYEVEQTTFHSLPALYLKLTDVNDYPGDRYLIKQNNSIFDVWYATKSDKYTESDMKRVQKMLDSLVLS